MQNVFLELFKLSLIGSLFAGAVMLIRLIFRKAPKWLFCILWGVVALRLICPVSIESNLSLIPDSLATGQIITNVGNEYIGDVEIIYESNTGYNNAIEAGRQPINSDEGYYVVTEKNSLEAPKTVGETVYPILSWVWAVGMVLMLAYTAVSFLLLGKKMEEATHLRDNIWQCEQADSPFVLGFIKPKIYLPYGITDSDMANVIAHEQAHIRRRDHWWKPVGFLLLSIYWFNPVLWLAYILLCRDIEAACDEKVIQHMEKDEMRAYSTALLHCSIHRRRISACPLAFGEVGVKERVKSVMNYKKPAFWIIVAAVISCFVVAVCFLTNPVHPVSYEEAEQFYQQISAEHPSMTDEEVFAARAEIFEMIARGSASEQSKFAQLTREVINSSNLQFEDEEVFDLAKDYASVFSRLAKGDRDFGVEKLKAKNLSKSTAQLDFSYWGEMWYSVKMLEIGDQWVTGEFTDPYQGELGQYLLLVQFHDADPSRKFIEQYPFSTDHKLRIPGLGNKHKMTMRIKSNADHGYDVYIGSDEPFWVEEQSSVRLYRVIGTVSVELHFGHKTDAPAFDPYTVPVFSTEVGNVQTQVENIKHKLSASGSFRIDDKGAISYDRFETGEQLPIQMTDEEATRQATTYLNKLGLLPTDQYRTVVSRVTRSAINLNGEENLPPETVSINVTFYRVFNGIDVISDQEDGILLSFDAQGLCSLQYFWRSVEASEIPEEATPISAEYAYQIYQVQWDTRHGTCCDPSERPEIFNAYLHLNGVTRPCWVIAEDNPYINAWFIDMLTGEILY